MLAVGLGFFLDLLIGDPHWLYHPVRLVGRLIGALERALRGMFPKTEKGELTAGIFLLLLTAGITAGAAFGLLFLAGRRHPYVRFALETLMCYQLLATKSLKDETMKVYTALKAGDVDGARHAVSMVVGRDTAVLDDVGITKAAVETIAENTSDGIVAPLLFMVIGGAPLGYFYKAVNTMDSMVGYKNEQYLYFGRAAAKFDDAVNYIPGKAVSGSDGMCRRTAWDGCKKCMAGLCAGPVQSQQPQFCAYGGGYGRGAAYPAGRKRILLWKII